jgi:ABC-type hemin transport system ATPase subunit
VVRLAAQEDQHQTAFADDLAAKAALLKYQTSARFTFVIAQVIRMGEGVI